MVRVGGVKAHLHMVHQSPDDSGAGGFVLRVRHSFDESLQGITEPGIVRGGKLELCHRPPQAEGRGRQVGQLHLQQGEAAVLQSGQQAGLIGPQRLVPVLGLVGVLFQLFLDPFPGGGHFLLCQQDDPLGLFQPVYGV